MHDRDTFKICYEYVGYAWCTSLKIGARFVRVWDQIILIKLKNFLEAWRVPGVSFIVSNKFHAHYRHVQYASNAFGTRFRHASVRYMRLPILLDIASVACPKRV